MIHEAVPTRPASGPRRRRRGCSPRSALPLPAVLLSAALLASPLLLAASAPAHPAAAQAASLVAEDGSFDLNRFYTADENDRVLRELHAVYPELTELYSIGRSRLGRELLVIEVTNEATGPASEKPALYVDGGIHAGELTGSAVALHLLGHLLNGYGSDARVTALLDRRAFYIRPKFNPDGSDLVLIHDQSLRSSVHPVDEDYDGRADEDPAQDLDGDGWITRMRVPDPEGPFYADPVDPRILRRVGDGPGEAPPPGATRYRTLSEGIDDDGDGRINEDGYGGLDMNRNFPRNWERIHLQPGAGPFPLSEPETHATVRFLVDHPNITGIVHGHTSGGFVYRLPSASDPTQFPTDDLAVIEALGAEYTRTTDRPVRPSSTDPVDHRYGTLISWGYWDQGVIGWVPEYSPGPEAWVTDYDGDGEISEAEELRFNDEELGGRYFSELRSFDHPELGPVEIGGWHSTFWGQNPPAEYLEEETAAQLPWHLYLAEQSPLLDMEAFRARRVGDGAMEITTVVTNEGALPTSATGRGAVGRERGDGSVVDRVVPPPTVTLELRDAELVEGSARVRLPHLRGTSFLPGIGEESASARWVVRATGPGAAVRIVARSAKGGVMRGRWMAVGG